VAKSVDLAVNIYKITDNEAIKHDYGMKDQIRRSASSISNNISEGFEYNNNKQFVNFLKIAKASAGELRNQLLIIHRVGKINEADYGKLNN
jgi:four helix bundle protein